MGSSDQLQQNFKAMLTSLVKLVDGEYHRHQLTLQSRVEEREIQLREKQEQINQELNMSGFELNIDVIQHQTYRETNNHKSTVKQQNVSLFTLISNVFRRDNSELHNLEHKMHHLKKQIEDLDVIRKRISAVTSVEGLLQSWWYLKCSYDKLPLGEKYECIRCCHAIYNQVPHDINLDSLLHVEQLVLHQACATYIIDKIDMHMHQHKEILLRIVGWWQYQYQEEYRRQLDELDKYLRVKNGVSSQTLLKTIDFRFLNEFPSESCVDIAQQSIELVQSIPERSTKFHTVRGSFSFMPSESKQAHDMQSEDAIFLGEDAHEIVAIICDGVSQSSFGGEAARCVKQELASAWLQQKNHSLESIDLIKERIVYPAMYVSQFVTHYLVNEKIKQMQDPLMREIIDDTFKSSGSQTTWSMVYTCDRYLVCAWMGNSRIMVKADKLTHVWSTDSAYFPQRLQNDDHRFSDDKIRFSSCLALTPKNSGMRGDVFIDVYDIHQIDNLHVFMHSDALEAFVKQLFVSQSLPEYVLFDGASIDDMSLIQLEFMLNTTDMQ
jgi:hypothetical protein